MRHGLQLWSLFLKPNHETLVNLPVSGPEAALFAGGSEGSSPQLVGGQRADGVVAGGFPAHIGRLSLVEQFGRWVHCCFPLRRLGDAANAGY